MTELPNPTSQSAQLLRWWHQHQTQWLIDEADTIRNGLLQDLFAIRRQMELVAGEECAGLATVEQLYGALEQLCDRLSSPYLEESLPLALQHGLNDWPAQVILKVELPTHWSPEPIETVSLLISMIDYLGQTLATLPTPPQSCMVQMAESGGAKRLTLTISDHLDLPSSSIDLCQTEDWSNYLATFEVLTRGKAGCTCDRTAVVLQLVW
ncbi:hypothetical protein VB780_08285 [Leptolyngbya sp. CCNP1308]|uniref:hypothetical protein n=1 Tax=Leptolyngbya sp. CCNP1308 TaxID=3110255 RepID=UPI002B1FD092|nr:hypothetical protein [Leptolyngbya sp. CCNP1308]MEA5448558.1 hypothetical protein [Leptolyngbya sp. CCNP1308]